MDEKLKEPIKLYEEAEEDVQGVTYESENEEEVAEGATMKHFSTKDLDRANELLVKRKVKLGLTSNIEK